MFCPRCASELVHEPNGELACPTGQMGLSRSMERLLTERYGNHTPSPNTAAPSTAFPQPLNGGFQLAPRNRRRRRF
jgi:hypothetical protein